MGWVVSEFFLADTQYRLYPHMRAKFGRDPTAGSKKVTFKFISRFFPIRKFSAQFGRPTLAAVRDDSCVFVGPRD